MAGIPDLRLPVSSSAVYKSRNYEFTHINAAHLPILGTVVQWDCTSLNDKQPHEKDISRKEGSRTYKKLSQNACKFGEKIHSSGFILAKFDPSYKGLITRPLRMML